MNREKLLRKNFNFLTVISIMVGTIVGSGIFLKQARILESVNGNKILAVLTWVFAGLISLTSTLVVAEISTKFSETGGLYEYCEKLFGPKVGFLSGWTMTIIYVPAIIGTSTSFLGILLTQFFDIDAKYSLPIGITVIVILAIINCFENRFAGTISIITTFFKSVPILALIIYGLFFQKGGTLHDTYNVISNSSGQNTNNSLITGFAMATLSALFTYDGWISITSITGEIKNPKKTLPRALITGIIFITVAYILFSISALKTLPSSEIISSGNDAAYKIMGVAFGALGGKLLSIGIIVSLFGSLNSKILTYPRIMWKMASKNDYPFAKIINKVNRKNGSPFMAVIFTVLIAVFMIFAFDIQDLSDDAILFMIIFYCILFYGIFILRKKESKITDSYKMGSILYPAVPIIAIVTNVFVIVACFYGIIVNLSTRLKGVIIMVVLLIIGFIIMQILHKRNN
jgi:APA family basic amino acid/polyamine antiporter